MGYEIKIEKVENSRLSALDFDNLKFGRTFSDHMFVVDYKDGVWSGARVVPFGNISMSPANMTLHYGQTIFEGLKAAINPSGDVTVFRPEQNAERLNRSAVRMGMPELPVDLFMEGLTSLLQTDIDWIPNKPGCSLYIRPFMFATDEYIGVKSSDTYSFYILTSPVGAYYDKAVSLLVADKYVRAAHGGVGEAKTAGNYAATLLPVSEANAAGFDQILWVDAKNFKNVQECGTMNLFFIINGKAITPPADGAILKGITRDSVIQLLKDRGIEVEIRDISVDELAEAAENGTLEDVFGTGTAAVITHVASFTYQGKQYDVPPVPSRTISLDLKAEIEGLRNGTIEDTHNWTYTVKAK